MQKNYISTGLLLATLFGAQVCLPVAAFADMSDPAQVDPVAADPAPMDPGAADPNATPAPEPVIEDLPTAAPVTSDTPATAPTPAPKHIDAPLKSTVPMPDAATMSQGISCVITAYYSPQTNQDHYATGSYARELVLEGNGTNGADGTQVFVGMIAASRAFPFGTKVYIPGFGMGEVHDRGGAINGTCRLDLWMGRGDLGLSRALAWGKRTVTCRVYFPGTAIPTILNKEAIHLQAPAASKEIAGKPIDRPFYAEDFTVGDAKAAVQDLESDLAKLHYFTGKPDTHYDLATAQAVFSFQKEHGIVTDAGSYGAGYFGYQTRRALTRFHRGQDVVAPTKSAPVTPQLVNLKRVLDKGSSGSEVSEAQDILSRAGYYPENQSTGIYGDMTRAAVLKFQLDHKLISSPKDAHAGVLGPVTAKKMLEMAAAQAAQSKVYAQGMRDEVIRAAQKQLLALGTLPGDAVTGYFGTQTRAALTAFQLSHGLISSAKDPNAGKLGPKTIAALAAPEKTRQIAASALKRGDRGPQVKELQLALVRVGVLIGPASGYFGENTETAVRVLQLRLGLVHSNEDPGAGMVSPETSARILALKADTVSVAAATGVLRGF